ncbi:MAG TPA: hypothetical protein VHI13_00395 [Candidatus Kapabacteria bacterium]|nr:hypothetical protein [Candidatus Kapabacteria bacterium]
MRHAARINGHGAAIAADQAGACDWVISNDRGSGTTIQLPDKQVVEGNEIRFVEVVDGDGCYPYHGTDQIDVIGNIDSYNILAEYVEG